MPKKVFRKITPSREKIQSQKILRIFGDRIYHNKLWSVNRKEISLAFLIGIFVALIPIPFQMVVSGFFAILLGANFPISILLVWLTNPITMPFIFYFEYYIGCLIFNKEPITINNFNLDNVEDIAYLLYSGSFICATTLSILSFLVINYGWIYLIKKRYIKRSYSRLKVRS